MKKQLKLAIFVWLINLAMWFLPDDATATYKWLTEMPYEN